MSRRMRKQACRNVQMDCQLGRPTSAMEAKALEPWKWGLKLEAPGGPSSQHALADLTRLQVPLHPLNH